MQRRGDEPPLFGLEIFRDHRGLVVESGLAKQHDVVVVVEVDKLVMAERRRVVTAQVVAGRMALLQLGEPRDHLVRRGAIADDVAEAHDLVRRRAGLDIFRHGLERVDVAVNV